LSASRTGPAATDVLLVAGEASGDLHGATLARALGALAPGLRLGGMGGLEMAGQGVRLLGGIEQVAVVGGTEAIRRLPALWRAFRTLRAEIRRARPGVVVLIDFPEFNMRLARAARRVGVPVVYFIAPQVWAWRRGRVRALARDVNRVLAIFPFEVGVYEEAGVPVEFVGHPLLDVLPALDRDAARAGLVNAGQRLIGLLPGSRAAELDRHLPVLLGAAERIATRHPGTHFALPIAPAVPAGPVEARLRASRVPVLALRGEAYRIMAAADLLLTASGTATLEAACFGTPMVVLYRLSRLSYVIARLLVRGVSHIALPNIVAGRTVVPELIQDQATAARVGAVALALLDDPAALVAQRAALLDVRARLGASGAGLRAARAVLRERDGRRAG
jgi:lipid-A-disaccharide synthase